MISSCKRLFGVLVGTGLLLLCGPGLPTGAQSSEYQRNLYRLAEVLGAMHHLRQICGASKDQLWRNQMIQLVKAEQLPPLIRTSLVNRFNRGYRNARSRYERCDAAAGRSRTELTGEGADLTNWLAQKRGTAE